MCNSIIKYSGSLQFQPSTYSTSAGKSSRSKEKVKMDDIWFRNGEPFYENLNWCFLEVIKKYQKEHPLFVCQRHTDFRLNKYSEGGFMGRHVDNIHHSHGQQYGYPQVSALLFLNDDYDGGEFVISDAEYNPKKGSAIIFPSNFMFPHEVKTIKKGIRYSIVTWLM